MGDSRSVFLGNRKNRHDEKRRVEKKEEEKGPDWMTRLRMDAMREEPLRDSLLTRGTIIEEQDVQGKVLRDAEGKNRSYDHHVRRVLTDPKYAEATKEHEEFLEKNRHLAERPWTKEGMRNYLEKTGHGMRALDIMHEKWGYVTPTTANTATADGRNVRMPMKRSDMDGSLSYVHEATHVENAGKKKTLLDKIVEEYKGTRKQIETYKDLKAQGYQLADPDARQRYEGYEKRYDDDRENDSLLKFIFDNYISFYRDQPGKDEPENVFDEWALKSGLLFQQFKEKAIKFR